MEESLTGEKSSLFVEIKDKFNINTPDLRTYSPLAFAFIGDAVYEIVIRSLVVGRKNLPPQKLHRISSSLVKASAQARVLDAVSDLLTEEEQDIARRGRNAQPKTIAKHATASDYHNATALEAVIGYLYLSGQRERILELIREGLLRTGQYPAKKEERSDQ